MPLSALVAIPVLASLALAYRADPGTVYLAADSRLTSTNPAAGAPDDTVCKIRVLANGIVFVGTGDAFFVANGKRISIYALAASQAVTLPPGPLQSADVRRVALQWQAAVHARLRSRLRGAVAGRPGEQAVRGRIGTTGAFYAATTDAAVYGVTVRVALGADGRLTNIEEPSLEEGFLLATGSEEAKQEALSLAGLRENEMLPWPKRLEAVERQTIQQQAARHGTRSAIGGPIDILAIAPGGPLWLARKASCE